MSTNSIKIRVMSADKKKVYFLTSACQRFIYTVGTYNSLLILSSKLPLKWKASPKTSCTLIIVRILLLRTELHFLYALDGTFSVSAL